MRYIRHVTEPKKWGADLRHVCVPLLGNAYSRPAPAVKLKDKWMVIDITAGYSIRRGLCDKWNTDRMAILDDMRCLLSR